MDRPDTDETCTRISPDSLILQASRRGLVTRRRLLELGLTAAAIDWRIDAGRLLPLGNGVYAVGRPAVGREAIWTAALLATGPGALLAGRSAATAWGIVRREGVVEVLRPRCRRPPAFRLGSPGLTAGRWVRVRSSRCLGDLDVARTCGIPVTSVPRTLLDLAGSMDESAFQAAFNEADRRRLLDRHDLARYSARGKGWKGAALFREAVRTRSPEVARSESELEAMFLRLCAAARLPAPEPNQRVLDFRVDCLWRDPALVVELDGYEFHRGRMAFEKDAARDNRLKRAGYQVLRFTWHMVEKRAEEVVDLVSQELAARGRGGTSGSPRP